MIRHLTFLLLLATPLPTLAATLNIAHGPVHESITALTPTIFRISLAAGGDPQPLASIELAADRPAGDVGRLLSEPGHTRLVTTAGAIDLDTASGAITLADAAGKIVLPASAAPTITGAMPGATPGATALAVHLGWPHDRPFDVYGCGNGVDTLLQHRVDSHLGNGIAVEPFFFAPAGYAVFALGGNDDHPATCDGKIENDAVTFSIPGSRGDVYLMLAPTLGDATRQLLSLTGRPPVPPRWALGYLQSRWGWKDKAYIDDALKQFQARHLPVDAFIFDFEWYTTHPDYGVPPNGMPGFSDFDFNPLLFPDPAAQIRQLHEAGVHVVGIRKPRIGNQETLSMIRSKGWGLTPASGERFDARAIRFASPAARDWYASEIEPLLRDGIDGWWNDEGEFTYTTYLNWNRAEAIAQQAVHPHVRMWTINRAFQPGLARFGAAAWTGDIRAAWSSLSRAPTDLLNWSAAGMPWCACDIGGYAGETTPQLLTRWMEAGVFFPVMRSHSEVRSTPHFPWLYGPQTESAIRGALELRYRLIPMLYSLAHETAETGEPVMRPLVMQYPNDPDVADRSDEWMIGPNLLAAPMLGEGTSRTIYLPRDKWYDHRTGKPIDSGTHTIDVPIDSIPFYVRAGTILPMGPAVEHTDDLPGDGVVQVEVYAGRDGTFTLVEDDGVTDAYESGAVRRTIFTWNDAAKRLSWNRTGAFDGRSCFRSVRMMLHDGPAEKTSAVTSLDAASGNVGAE